MSQEAIQSAAKLASQKGFVLYAGEVLKRHDKGGQGKRIVVITDVFISYYRKSQAPEGDRCFCFADLKSLEFKDDTCSLLFEPARPCIFSSSEMPKIKHILTSFLAAFLTSAQFHSLGIEFPASIDIEYPYPPISRARSFAMAKSIELPKNVMDDFVSLLHFRSSKIILPNLAQSPSAIAPLLFALQIVPAIKSVVLPSIQGEILFPALSNISSSFSHISFNSLISPQFSDFLRSITPSNQISGLSFKNSGFSPANIEELSAFCDKHPLSSLSFEDSMLAEAYPSFYDKFFIPSVSSSLQMLRIDHSPSIKLDLLLPHLLCLKVLSLTSCSLEVSDSLAAIGTANLAKLEALNLSSNISSKPIAQSTALPPNLKRIDLSSIQWAPATFAAMHSLIFNFDWKEGARIDLSNAEIEPAEMQEFFDKLKTYKPSLVYLNWSKNSCPKKMADFLSANDGIVTLIVSECFAKNDTEAFASFVDYIRISKGLKNLIIRGNAEKTIPDAVSLISAAKSSSSLEVLDISKQSIEDNGVNAIGELIVENPSLKLIAFDGCKVSSITVVDNLLSTCHNLPKKVKLSWPASEFALLNAGEKQEAQIKEMAGEPVAASAKGFDLLCIEDLGAFEDYLGEKLIDSLKSEERRVIATPKPEEKKSFYEGSGNEEEEKEDKRPRRGEIANITKEAIPDGQYSEPKWELQTEVLTKFDKAPYVEKLEKKYSLLRLHDMIK